MKLQVNIVIIVLSTLMISACSISNEKQTPEDVLRSDEYWEPIHSDALAYGGGDDYILVLINPQGDIVFISSYTPGVLDGALVRVFVGSSFNDPERIEVLKGSDLERYLKSILDNLEYREHQKVFGPFVDEFRRAISNRKDFVGIKK